MSAGSNCDGYKDDGITFPSGEQQMKLFKRVAQLADIDPSTIDFMEAHGSATRVCTNFLNINFINICFKGQGKIKVENVNDSTSSLLFKISIKKYYRLVILKK